MSDKEHYEVLVYSFYPRDPDEAFDKRELQTPVAGFRHDDDAEAFCLGSLAKMQPGSKMISVNIKDGYMIVHRKPAVPPVPEVPEDDASTS